MSKTDTSATSTTVRYYSGIMEAVKFWRACLRRAKKYFAEDPEVLDRIYDGEMEDLEIE